MSREAETKVLGAIAEYIEEVIGKVEALDARLTELSAAVSKEGIQSIVDAKLDDYNPTEHMGFGDAVRDATENSIIEAVSEAVGEMEFEATITPRTRRRY